MSSLRLRIVASLCVILAGLGAAAAVQALTASKSAVGGGQPAELALFSSGTGTPLFAESNVAPGWQASACIAVGPEGAGVDGIGLFGTIGGGLASALRLTVSRGSGGAGGHSCSGFSPARQVYNGPLSAWPQEASAIADGVRLAAGQRAVYRFTVALPSSAPPATQRDTASMAFSFGADPAATAARPECSDGIDNDGDGRIDHPADTGCASPSDTSEREDARMVDDLVLCGRRAISLISATKVGRRVKLHGVVSSGHRGASVAIFDGTRKVATTLASTADGQFRASVRAPSRKRHRKARYSARVGSVRSVALKLPQSLESTAIRVVGSQRKIELRGRVFPPHGRRPQAVVIRRILCGRYQLVGRARPSRNGVYRIRFSAPDAAAGLYRAETRVPARAGSRKLKRAYARAIAISLDERSG